MSAKPGTERVLTPFGFGRQLSSEFSRAVVELEEPHLGDKKLSLDLRSEVFAFSDHALIRVLNVTGVGLVSTMQFYPGCWGAIERALHAPCPPDETRILVHLDTGRIEVSHDMLGSPDGQYLRIDPWIDRWASERVRGWDDKAKAVEAFDWMTDRKRGGTTGGILAKLLVDTAEKSLLRLAIMIAPPQEIIYRWPPEKGAAA
jgi:hypothetical protein